MRPGVRHLCAEDSGSEHLISMENAVQEFIEYLRVTRKSSDNTLVSYRRDLNKLTGYLQEVREISDWKAVTETDLNAYLLYLEKGSYAASSISRSVASCHAFFQYLRDRNRISSDPSRMLRPPNPWKRSTRCSLSRRRPPQKAFGTAPCWSFCTPPGSGSPSSSA